MQISKFTRINFLLAIVFVIIALIYPIFLEKVFYSSKSDEAIFIADAIQKKQNLNYVNNNKYIAIKKGDIESLTKIFNLKESDIQFYNYSIFTTFNSYTLYAEPKIEYLKSRDISPANYIYHKKLNTQPTSKWQ